MLADRLSYGIEVITPAVIARPAASPGCIGVSAEPEGRLECRDDFEPGVLFDPLGANPGVGGKSSYERDSVGFSFFLPKKERPPDDCLDFASLDWLPENMVNAPGVSYHSPTVLIEHPLYYPMLLSIRFRCPATTSMVFETVANRYRVLSHSSMARTRTECRGLERYGQGHLERQQRTSGDGNNA